MKTQVLRKWSAWILLAFLTQAIHAQQLSVKGTIISGTDQFPIIGASIMEKGTTNGTISDLDGNFTLTVATGAILQISYIGFATQELPAAEVHTEVVGSGGNRLLFSEKGRPDRCRGRSQDGRY